MRTAPRRVAMASVLLLTATALAWTAAQAPTRVDAAGETIISTFYVPLFEDNARAALFAVNGGTGTQLSSTTSITIGASGAIIYYDNWEDGYEAAANVKVQASTLVFGDGNPGNGDAATYCVPARCAGDNLPAGAVLRLNNSASIVPGPITTPRAAATVVFDGRDKISSTDGLAVTHATWPTAINALHSEMAAAFDTSRWGISFAAPVGTNTPAQGAGTASFTYSGIEVMAREANTLVQIDINNDGDFLDPVDINSTIGEGQTVYVNGAVLQGTKVLASKPVQMFMMTGVIGSNYENRSFQVFPTEGLVNDYVAPASSARADGTYATVLYLFNPQPAPITVTVQTSGGSTNYTIPASTTLNPAPSLPTGQAARVTSTSTFAALAGIGTREVAANSLNYDWGYSLLPARVITDSLVVGWSPGSQDLTVATYDPVWVTLLAPTTLFVDYDSDPATGANVDPNGNRYDTAIAVPVALTQLRVTDATDRDMTGSHLYTVDGVGVAAAYGEDPAATTPVAFPGVDLGTTLFPACGALCIRKLATIAIDVDGDGLVDPGDTLRWSVEATNTDYYALVNPILFDALPAGVVYVPGSTTVVVNAGPPVAVADDTVPPAISLFPYDEGGRQLNANIPVGGKVTAFFDTLVDPAFAGTAAICNRAIVTSSRDIIGTSANGADTGCSPVDGLRITKVSSAGGNPVLPGQALAYTVVVTNQSSGTVTNAAVTDPLPAGLTWVSTSVTRPATVTPTIADDMETTATWAGSTGTQPWSGGAWTEVDAAGAGTTVGNLRRETDAASLRARFRPTAAVGTSLTRLVGDLSAYSTVTLSLDKRCVSLENDDTALLEIRPTAAAAWTTLATYTSCDDAAYVPASFSLTPAGQFGAATEIRLSVTQSFDAGDSLFIDNVQFAAVGRVVQTVAGSAPPNLVTLTDLLPGEIATIVINTTVNNPYTATDEIANSATVRAGNQVARAEVIDCVRCFDYGDDPTVYNGTGGLDPARARAVSPRSYFADTFQSLGYSGSTGTVPWAGTSWVEADTGAGGPTGGQVQNVIDGSTRSIQIGGAAATAATTNALSRVIGDLTSFSEITLGYEYRCTNLDATDVVQLQIRPTGGATPWTALQSFSNCNNATIYSSNQLALLPANYGTATEIRFVVTTAFEGGESFFFDDVQIRATATAKTTGPRLGTVLDREVQGTGGASPNVAISPAAPNGDDLSGTDDEEGVTVPSVDTNTIQIPITVTDSSAGVRYVNGWLDWSNGGGFTAAESIFDAARFVSATGGLTVVGGTGQIPGPGTYTVTVSVPDLDTNGSGYAIGSTVYSRFRVATQRTGVTSPTGASLDGEVEDYSTTLNTLPVSIAYFGSTRSRGNVTLNWRTAQEIDNLGFSVYAQAVNGSLTLLTPDLVISKAPTSIESQEYSLTVATRSNQIWLEDISLDGVSELHGPYSVGSTLGDAQPPAEIDWTAARQQVDASLVTEQRLATNRARAASSQRLASPAAAPVGPVARLDVTLAGVQQVTYEQLRTAGVDLAGVASSLLAVTDQSGPIQIEVVGGAIFGPGSALRFIGQPLDTLYSGTNVYRVHIDPKLARRIARATPNPPATTTTTTAPVAPTTTRPRRRSAGESAGETATASQTSRGGRTTTTTTASAVTPSTTPASVSTSAPATTTTGSPVGSVPSSLAPASTSTTVVVSTTPVSMVPPTTATTSATTSATTTTSTSTATTSTATTSTSTSTTSTSTSTSTSTATSPAEAGASYTETATLEQNNSYSVTAPGDDPWFDRLLVAIDGSPSTASASLMVSSPIAGQSAIASVELWGITRDDIIDDHHVRLTVNGVAVGDARFDNNNALLLQGTVPAGVLRAGGNTLEVTLVGDNGVSVDIIAVDAWHLTYQRSIVAVEGRLDFSAAGVTVAVAGMPAGTVLGYRVGTDGVVTKLIPVVTGAVVRVPGTPTAQRYVVSAASAVRSPVVAPARAAVDLLRGSADYLVITNGVLTSALAPLLAYHQSLGRSVKVVDVADVYEAYSGGVVDAKAIDRYLAAAVPALHVTWVLLVGADSVDYRDYDGDGSFSLLPSLYGATDFGITYAPIDPAYADINGDGTPDVALGRLPARTPAELSAMIAKTLAYSKAQPARSLLLVSDQSDGLDYAAVNDTLAARFAGWTVSRSDIDRGGVAAALTTLTDAINNGVGVTMYLGHSSSQQWTEAGLFDVASAQALTNVRPTLVVQFGCWNTYYVSPDSDTLAHALLLNTAGAAAVVGSTTLTSSGNDVLLAGYVANHLAAGNMTIGEVVLAAKQDLKARAAGAITDVQLGFTILGDPALPAGGTA